MKKGDATNFGKEMPSKRRKTASSVPSASPSTSTSLSTSLTDIASQIRRNAADRMLAIPGKSMAVHLLIRRRIKRSRANLNSNLINTQHFAVYTCCMLCSRSIHPWWQWSWVLNQVAESMNKNGTSLLQWCLYPSIYTVLLDSLKVSPLLLVAHL